MTLNSEDQKAHETLKARLKTILPAEYQDCYDDVQPVSMGSAGLKYGSDGKVAWNEMWSTFCDLAMAGGPPHKGTLLEPGSGADIDAQPDRYRQVVDEICRGITMVTDLPAQSSPMPGWLRVPCESPAMAAWLLRAIVMENVSARCDGAVIYLPASPAFRLEKEIKNVITVIAKTCHYWVGHMWPEQPEQIANLFAEMELESPLIEPPLVDNDFRTDRQMAQCSKMADAIHRTTGLRSSTSQCIGWLGVQCPDVRSAVWIMRAMVVTNVLCRREGSIVFVPVDPRTDPDGEAVVQLFARIHRFAIARHIL
jgi:sirohydrochlorin cobaltochelatase